MNFIREMAKATTLMVIGAVILGSLKLFSCAVERTLGKKDKEDEGTT